MPKSKKEESNEELGYSKSDYRNKDTDNIETPSLENHVYLPSM